MIDALNSLSLWIADLLLGWLLYLPRDLVLIAVALISALVLTVVRLFTTDQDMLKRCRDDKARLKQLIRNAKQKGEKEAIGRHRLTLQQIGMRRLAAEGKPLLASLIPIIILVVWAFARVAYLPAAPGADVSLRMYFPAGDIGTYAHIVPREGIDVDGGWIRQVGEDVLDGQVMNGICQWTLRCRRRSDPYVLRIRHKGRLIERDLHADGVRYAAPLVPYGDDPSEIIETVMVDYKPFGVVPGVQVLWLQPWIVGYLLIVLPLSFLLKPVLRIY